MVIKLPLPARRTDPLSSKLAAQQITASGTRKIQCEAVLDAVKQYPFHTSREIAQILDIDRYVPSRRLPDLEKQGLVCRCQMRKCKVGGKISLTWCATAQGAFSA